MPKPKAPRKKMAQVPLHQIQAEREARAAAPTVTVHKPAMDPQKVALRRPSGMSWRTKGGAFAAGTAAVGGTAYLAHHYSRRTPVTKLYDPFTDTVVNIEKRDHREGAKRGAKIGAGLTAVALASRVPAIRHSYGELVASGVKRSHAAGSLAAGAGLGTGINATLGAGIGGAIGTSGKKKVKKMYDPFLDQEVGVEKQAQGFAVTNVRRVSALVPTGKHVSHANDLHVTRHGKRTTKNAQALLHRSK